MADVTISNLTKGIPAGSAILPYSTGNSTLGVPVSAIFQNTSNLLIGTDYMPGYTTNKLSVNGGVLMDGDISFAQDVKAYFIRVPTNGGAIRLRGNSQTGADRRLQLGVIDNLGNWTSKITVNDGSVNLTDYICSAGLPAFHVWNKTAQSLSSDTVMTFNATSTSQGRVFNQGGYYANNRFIAPAAGVYHFSANVLLNSVVGGSYRGIGLVLNGTDTLDFCYAAGTSQQGLNLSTTIKLALNDYVDIRGSTDGTMNMDNSGTFSGHLVG